MQRASDSEEASGRAVAQSSEVTKTKRSRTGCLTCRTRRRKCDEGRPVCQNCISKSLDCRYSAPFQILGKNNFTPEVVSRVKYANVQFVSDDSTASTSEAGRGASSSQLCDIGDNECFPNLIACEKPIEPDSAYRGGHQEDAVEAYATSPNSYEFALRGLLELGAGDGGANISRPAQPLLGHPETPIGMAESPQLVPIDPNLTANDVIQSPLRWATVNTRRYNPGAFSLVSSDLPASNGDTSLEDLDFLKYYRYHIAPWLDIYDNEQYFGVKAVVLSCAIPELRRAILQVASQARTGKLAARLTMDCGQSRSVSADSKLEWVHLMNTLDYLQGVFKNLSMLWQEESVNHNGQRLVDGFLRDLNEGSQLSYSAYWLTVRILLSCAMLDTAPIHIPLKLTADTMKPVGNESVALATQNVISLCVDAVVFSHGDDDKWLQSRYDLNRFDMWNLLIESFAQWYMHRPQELQPIVELYSKDGFPTADDFPTIVFTSSGAIMANQLYHTGMLFLLQNKPRFASRPISTSSSMSTLWHAHRICGIAIQNDGPNSWDPCLVASLLVAARTITHQSQHTSIVSTLETAQRLTGWNFQSHIDELKSEWRLAGNW